MSDFASEWDTDLREFAERLLRFDPTDGDEAPAQAVVRERLDELGFETYEWTADSWNGFRDFAQHPRDCVDSGRGDCEDYALVALASAVARGRPGVGIAFCWELPYPWPTHVIAFDDDFVYSSGDIVETSVDEWVRDSPYTTALRRRLRTPPS